MRHGGQPFRPDGEVRDEPARALALNAGGVLSRIPQGRRGAEDTGLPEAEGVSVEARLLVRNKYHAAADQEVTAMWTVHLGLEHEDPPDPIVRERWTDAKDVLRRTLEERRTLALALWNRRGFDELNEALWTLQEAKPDQPFSVRADRCS